jgi:hypothetical protein
MGNRFLTFNTIVRVRQIEVTRDTAHGPDESSVHTPAEARTFRGAIEAAWPGARITWAFSWLALHDERPQYRELRALIVSYQKKFGDEITFIPGAYFSNMYNTREQVNRDLHEGLKRVSELVGDGYRPKSVVAGFLASENLRYLAEKENIHVCQGNIWSQYAVDNGDGEGSIAYPYYPSREHFCKPAQEKKDLIDCVNLDGWTVDFLAARIPGGRTVNGERWRSRQGVGPIETLLDMGTERGTKAMLATTASHFDDGFTRNGFAWVTCGWEMGLVEARKIYGYGGKNGMEGLHLWLTEIRKRWPDAKLITQGEFGLLWRAQFKNNDKLDYRFVYRGCGIRASESDKEISWYMNKDFRLAILRDWQTNAPGNVIDFTRYDLPVSEPADPEPGKQSRNWSLMNRLNQKGVRPQDKPVSLQELTPEEQALIKRRYPELIRDVDTTEARLPKIEWPDFMRQHDMTFNTLPRNWKEAPHFGNAMVGSMLYQVDNTIRLQVFRADVQDQRDDTWGWTAYSRPRLVIGSFSLVPAGKLTGFACHKDLWNAELTGTITTDKGKIRIRHLTHAIDMAIVTELTPSAGEKGFTWTWHPAPAKSTRSGYPVDAAGIERFAKSYGSHLKEILKIDKPNPAGRLEKREDVSVWIQDLLVGGQYATAWAEQTSGDRRTHIVTIANSFPEATAAETAVADVNRFMELDRGAWVETHRAWWHTYYPKSFVTIPDKKLESLYWQTIYRYGCTTRAGRAMVDTPGIWFQGAQWPYITTDWNIQSAHWAVYTANRLEQGEEVVNKLYEGREALVQAVRPVEWQKDSAYLAVAVAPDMRGSRDGDMRYYNLVGNLPWTLHNAWMQYRYSMDDAMLREKIYPLLRRSMNLYLHMVEEGKDGKLHLSPTYSPESGIWQDCAFDLALFKWGCLTLLKASKHLGIEDPLIPRWKDVAARLVDLPTGEKGLRQGSDKPLLEHHRHLSHLLSIYPLYLVNIEQEGMREVLLKSMQQSLALNSSDHNAAMVQTHAVPIATALGEGEHALRGLAFHQADLLPNGLWACSGNPCIESTLSLANNIQEMLLQSWSDPAKDEPVLIRVFPAVPAEWKEIEFRDLRAEGAFLVSAKRVGGQTQWVKIKSLAGEPCRVKPGFKGRASVTGARASILKQPSPDIYEIGLSKGEEVTLAAERECK